VALVGAVTLAVLVSGCVATSGGSDARRVPGSPSASPSASSGAAMPGMEMAAGAESGPSSAARMVCEEHEVRDAVRRSFRMDRDPTSTHTWSAASRVYTCRWAVPHGTLTMTVDDATDPRAGRRSFARLRAGLVGARPLRGMDAFGLPALSTAAGDVAFLKDGKTLHVDATRLPAASLPRAFSRSEVAYSVASAAIACWTE